MAFRPWNLLSLCAGVDGLGLGVQLAEPLAVCVAHVEREAAAAATLVARMAQGTLHSAPVWSDLGTFNARPWRGVVDCVISGDPCQPNSVAGKRLGAADDRFLIDQVIRIVGECRPRRVFRENVTGNADGQLAVIVPALERLGFRVAAGIFSAAEVGGSHRRERLIIMADAESERPRKAGRLRRHGPAQRVTRGGENLGKPVGARWPTAGAGPEIDTGRQSIAGRGFMGNPESVGRGQGRTEHELWGRRNAFASNGSELADADGTDAQRWRECGGAFGWQEPIGYAGLGGGSMAPPIHCPPPDDPRWPEILRWAPHLEPAICGMVDGPATRVDQLRAIGNGVHPLAIGYAWRTLEALLAETAGDVAVSDAA
jgi:DNA (cytosine-5)-methyltransferase 1